MHGPIGKRHVEWICDGSRVKATTSCLEATQMMDNVLFAK